MCFSEASIEAVSKADLCLALGTELGEPSALRPLAPLGRITKPIRKWIYVQQDPQAIGVNRSVDVPLVGDLRAVVPQLVRPP